MKRAAQCFVLAWAVFGWATPASADVVDFTGVFSPAQWTLSAAAQGFVDPSGAPASIALTGGNDESGLPSLTRYSIKAPFTALVSFTWSYLTVDSGGPDMDRAGYFVGGTDFQLSRNNGFDTQNGRVSALNLSKGQTFGFYVQSMDSSFGPATLSVGNFRAVSLERPLALTPTPEPSTVMLTATALAIGLTRLARRRKPQPRLG